MKNVDELRIPAYAVVNVEYGNVLSFASSRDEARYKLSVYKSYEQVGKAGKFKILKLVPQKFVR